MKESSQRTNPKPLEDFLLELRQQWIASIIFANEVDSHPAINASDVPPIIAPALRGSNVQNTEMQKKSIYLNRKCNSESKCDSDSL